jgi:hypothetical protein
LFGEAFDELGLDQALWPFVIMYRCWTQPAVLGRGWVGRGNRKRNSYLLGTPVTLAHILAVLQPGQDLLYRLLLFPGLLLLETLAALAGFLLLHLKRLLDELDVLEPKLFSNDVKVTCGVDISLDVNDLCVVKATDDLEDGIDGTNM